MRGAYTSYLTQKGGCNGGSCGGRKTAAVEQAVALNKERAELRLARIQNGKDPRYKNGKTLVGCSETTSGS